MNLKTLKYMFNWFKKYLCNYKKQIVFVVFFSLLMIVLNLFQVDSIQKSIDAAVNHNWNQTIVILSLFVVFNITRILSDYFFGYYANYIDSYIRRDIRDNFTLSVLRSKYNTKQESGQILTNFNNDINTSVNFIKDGFFNLFINPLFAIGGFIYLLSFNWKLALVSFSFVPLLTVLLNILSNRSTKIFLSKLKAYEELSEEVYDISHGIETIKVFGMQSYIFKKSLKTIDKIFNIEINYSKNDAFTVGIILAVSYIPNILTLIYGGYLAFKGEISVSLLFAYSQLIPIVNTPTINVFSSLKSIKESYQSMKRLDSSMLNNLERTDGEIFNNSNIAIELKNASFSYDEEVVLKNSSFSLFKGECVGIVGNSGSGKTTLINLICGFLQLDNGNLYLFDQEISKWNLTGLRSNIALVPQDNYIFPGTIYDNIRYGNFTAHEHEILKAAIDAGLEPLISSLPNGINTIIEESGSNISAGQKQRIGLARAFLSKAKIIIYDEPTSSLDNDTENYILNSIKKSKEDKIIIIVSHNVSVLKVCDKIYMIDKGEIVENDTLSQLDSKDGPFYELFKLQIQEDNTL